jgi:hypothetical protein
MMKNLFLTVFFAISAALSASAQLDASKMKLDSITATRNKPAELVSSLPPANKTLGVEWSPIRLLVGTATADYKTQLLGGVSLFSVDRRAEIAFPFLFMIGNIDGLPAKIVNMDVTYRRFFKKQQKGFYYSAGLRYNFLQGAVASDNPLYKHGHTDEQLTQSRAGLYFGIGYRHFFRKGWYWGTSFILGLYSSKVDPRLYFGSGGGGDEIPPLDAIFAWDIGKFGFAF